MIRRARPDDEAVLDRLQSELREPNPDLLSAALAEASSHGAADHPRLASFDLFVAVAERSVVGYLLAVRGNPTHVAEVVVAPDHRRRGYGAALFDHLFTVVAERHADDDSHLVRLAVSPDDDEALAFYHSLRFHASQYDADYYGDDPALLLVKSIDCSPA